jgi:hypothetical protein
VISSEKSSLAPKNVLGTSFCVPAAPYALHLPAAFFTVVKLLFSLLHLIITIERTNPVPVLPVTVPSMLTNSRFLLNGGWKDSGLEGWTNGWMGGWMDG